MTRVLVRHSNRIICALGVLVSTASVAIAYAHPAPVWAACAAFWGCLAGMGFKAALEDWEAGR